MSLIRPSFNAGFARNKSESRFPELWDGLEALYDAGLGPQGSTLFDLAGRGLHGQLTNMEPSSDWIVSNPGWVLDFDGVDEYVTAGNVLGFERTDRFSVLIRWKSPVNPTTTQAVVGKISSSGAAGWALLVLGASGGDPYRVNLVNVSPDQINVNFPRSNNGLWHETVLTYDGSSTAAGVKLWEDGVELAPTVVADALTGSITNALSFQIAAREGSSSPFLGQVSRCMVWRNRVLTSGDIINLYIDASPLTLRTSSPVYLFQETTGVLEGTVAWVWGESGSLSGTGNIEGSSAWIWTEAGALTASGALDGTVAWVWTESGTLSGGDALAGTAAWTWTAVGTGTTTGSVGVLQGTANWIWTASLTVTLGSIQGDTDWFWSTDGDLNGCKRYTGCVGTDFTYESVPS